MSCQHWSAVTPALASGTARLKSRTTIGSLTACVVLVGLLAPVCAPAVSMWQGGGEAAGVSEAERPPQVSTFLVLDTGGSGGMFGRGDLRQNLRDVAFWEDGQHGVSSGDAGVFYTDDGGLSWSRVRKHPKNDYPDEKGVIYYHAELSGPRVLWVTEGKHPAVARRLWYSADAGASWEDLAPRFPGTFESVWGLLARGPHVWVLGGWSPEASYGSDDGGKTWRRLSLPDGFEPFHAVTPADAPLDELATVYLLGASRNGRKQRVPALFRSDDGGNTWRELPLPEHAATLWQLARDEIAFATVDHGMIALPAQGLKHVRHGVWEKPPGATACVLVTEDGGQTWTSRDLPNEELTPTALWQDPANPDHAFVGVWNAWQAQHGTPRRGPALYETFDAGRTWTIAIRGKPQINAIFGLDSRRVWAVGNTEGFQANDVVAVLQKPGGPR